MPAHRTARERARAEITTAIKEEARNQLATAGADGLSLRAVARQLGMVSSALYRYFPSRDDLLTVLIIDAYNAVGEQAERAAARESGARERWRAICHAIRDWARAHPHEYSLIYGSPIPGYRAPQDTITPASRVPVALARTVHDGWAAGTLTESPSAPDLPPGLREQARVVTTAVGVALPDAVVVRTLIAWTQLFGMVGFELTGQLVGSMDPADEFFAHAVEEMTRFVGLT
ncbi:TetR/AcrR family transcriptional regulator [Prauserella muralis]|uniref:TetR family transcriptional regulator n=1 Tax=Prauserella muralis TaxID=588067 RepID=A0A2V4BB93_9PSEU|nr:TetR/AcrR family transcriptional regulator [Prauserella muralis]PXY31319.1 TetR family transcriptional regulator [Prauserella muralis]TWE14363.1 TetR family transcriptional regulator [Prauserella muralis]